MRLLKILATCGVLQIAHAGFVDKARHAKSMGPEHKPPALSLLSVLQPVNATHVDVSITNSYSEHISILSWNNLLQTNQHAAYGSFKLSRAFSNGSIQQLGRGSNTGYYHSPETFSSHFVNITARGAYANTFDLTKLFSILEAGTYNVTMDFTSPAALVANETDFSNMLQKAKSGMATFEAMSMPHVRIKSGTLSVNLQASSASQTNRKRTGTTVEACSTQPQASAAVVRARGYARSLAKYSQQYVLPPLGIAAHGLIDDTLWKQYFRNDLAAQNVSNVYGAIAKYDLNGDVAGIQELCDLDDNDKMCTDDGGVVAYSSNSSGAGDPNSGGGSYIIFCSGFFRLPVAATCVHASESNTQVADQGGVLLHELAKSEALTRLANVTDGGENHCSTWCV